MKRPTALFWLGAGLGAGFVAGRMGLSPLAVVRVVAPPILSRLIRDRAIDDLAAALEASGQRAAQRLIDIHPSRRNYQLLNHVIGIERWGQNRLGTALDRPLVLDEYDGYRPPRNLSWNELQDLFVATRRETIELAAALNEAGAAGARILHNAYGSLTAAAWLFYLDMHARWELSKMG